MANPVMWFEIIGKDSAGLQKFYRETFGWRLTPPVKEMGNYSMLEGHEPGPGGGIGEGDARVSIYIETPDPQSLVEKAQRNGATVLMPVTSITPTTTIAMLMDPAGNTFGLMKSPQAQRGGGRTKSTSATGGARKKTTARRKSTSSGSSRKKTTARRSRRR